MMRLTQSCRSACIGAMRAARRAGSAAASTALASEREARRGERRAGRARSCRRAGSRTKRPARERRREPGSDAQPDRDQPPRAPRGARRRMGPPRAPGAARSRACAGTPGRRACRRCRRPRAARASSAKPETSSANRRSCRIASLTRSRCVRTLNSGHVRVDLAHHALAALRRSAEGGSSDRSAIGHRALRAAGGRGQYAVGRTAARRLENFVSAGDAHHRGPARAFDHERPADAIEAGEQLARQRLVDDDDARRALAVGPGHVAPAQQREAQRLEEARARRNARRRSSVGCPGGPALKLVRLPASSPQRDIEAERTPGSALEPAQHLLVEVEQPPLAVAVQGRVQLEHQHVLGSEPERLRRAG